MEAWAGNELDSEVAQGFLRLRKSITQPYEA